MTTRGDRLRERFPAAEHKTYTKPLPKGGSIELTYVEDETVMGRLDEVLGLGTWQWKVEVVDLTNHVVKGQLLVKWDTRDEWCSYQDFGYPTNPNGAEPLKEAMTDAFRRCGRLIGIARYVYAGDVGGPAPTAPRKAAPAAPAPAVPPAAEDWDALPPLSWDEVPTAAADVLDARPAGWLCPDHSEPWKHVPAGTSKTTGNPYSAFWACPEKGCKKRPSIEWIASQQVTA